MDHLCKLEEISVDYKKLRNGQVTQVIWSSRKEGPPYNYLFSGDKIYFISQEHQTLLSTTVRDVNTLKKISKKTLEKQLRGYDPSLSSVVIKRLLKGKYFVIFSFEPIKEVTDYRVDKDFFLTNSKWILSSNALIGKENNKNCQ